MQPSSRASLNNKVHIEKVPPFTLGFREIIFLSTILFIGFSGFNVCVDKITGVSNTSNISSITVYEAEYTTYFDGKPNPKSNIKVN